MIHLVSQVIKISAFTARGKKHLIKNCLAFSIISTVISLHPNEWSNSPPPSIAVRNAAALVERLLVESEPNSNSNHIYSKVHSQPVPAPAATRICLLTRQRQEYVFSPNSDKDMSSHRTSTRICLLTEQRQEYVFSPNSDKDISSHRTATRIYLLTEQRQGYVFSPNSDKDMSSAPNSDKDMSSH
ncbi:unnamed protein product [Acanthosepion pharaonis]|uniref:Uncharacterized protein n=1 Tax=Acanthosepion pharaonis TaxID=158019 RepID=A0A812AM48_ACAPH|nr:unnamed protein product [Sepia pharaonis]